MTMPAPRLALYVHWPFCQSKCPYCDFNSHVTEAIDHARARDLITAAEARELGMINTEENRAKHEGLGWDGPPAISRSVPPLPLQSFRI